MINALIPRHNADGWHVVDTDGGVWWPNDDAQTELERADDSAALVVAMCESAPMRGEWRS